MQAYLEKLKPQVGNAWRTDELFVNISGNTKYLYAVMDDETRFWIAHQVSFSKPVLFLLVSGVAAPQLVET